jgi:hypothetical protein
LRLRKLLLSTVPLVPLFRLDSVLLKKLSLTEIEKESNGGSTDVMVNEKRKMMISVDPKDNLKVKCAIVTGSCLLVIPYHA